MMMYHCNLSIGAFFHDIFSFNLVNMARLIHMGWLSVDAKCLPGAFI